MPWRVGTEFPAPGMAPMESLEGWWHSWEQGPPGALSLCPLGPVPAMWQQPKAGSDGRMTHRDSAAGVFPIRAVQVSTIRNAAQPECESLIGNIPQMHMRGPRGRCQPWRGLGGESRRDGSHMRRHQRPGCSPGVSVATSANFDQGLSSDSQTVLSHLFPKCEEPEATLETLRQFRIPLQQSQGQDNGTLMLLTYWFRVSLFPFPSIRPEQRALPCSV